MPTIHQIPEHIVAQIAAGEVIERPAYALKELVENAIDAGADHIQIFLENAGLKKVMVIDNGHGMSTQDLRESYKHHTTSKLNESLIGIKSFGFRGEALSSIAAISSMVIKSRSADAPVGTMIELNNGNLIKESSVGMPKGTAIIIHDLFNSVPARKKFLKSQRTEFRHSIDIVLQMAIAHPNIRFQLIHNNKTIFDYPKTQDTLERVRYLFGNDVVSHMVPIASGHSYVTIEGFISSPHIVSTNTSKQFLFVNNRSVTDRMISQTIKESYGSLLDTNSYPLFALLITLPHEMVDVNVHPRKEQIALMNKDSILEAVKKIIHDTITKSNLNYAPYVLKKNKNENMPEYATTILRDMVIPWGQLNMTKLLVNAGIVQIHNLYIITQTSTGIIFIDQHAAHERILFEEYLTAFNQEKKNSKPFHLSEAYTINISPSTKELLTELKNPLKKLGFVFEDFGNDAIKVTYVPSIFKDHDIRSLFLELTEILQTNDLSQTDTQSNKMIAYLACRNAVMAGDKLTKQQCKDLVKKLDKTPNNYTCPHGRPTKVEFQIKDIHKLFKRI